MKTILITSVVLLSAHILLFPSSIGSFQKYGFMGVFWFSLEVVPVDGQAEHTS